MARRRIHILSIRVTKTVEEQDLRDLQAHETKLCANRGEAMTHPSCRTIRPLLALVFAFLTVCAAAAPAFSQEKKVAQKNGVDISKMGAYRALAQHIYTEFQRGDIAAAAELGTVLERVWDKAEEYGGDTALAKTNRPLFVFANAVSPPYSSALSQTLSSTVPSSAAAAMSPLWNSV